VTGMRPESADLALIATRYRRLDLLGTGGMGTVWRAHDTLLRRTVALKEVRIPFGVLSEDRDRAERRVYREARAAARLNHPGAVTVFDVLREGGSVYIVMELVDAPTLDQLARTRGPLPPREVADIGFQLLDVLVTAHARGIVHRDVKPANVMISDGGSVKLADFGVASLADEPKITTRGLTVGSPAFMAPEQASAGAVGPPTDLWALGATMYFAVEGRPPFERNEPIATLTAVVHEDVPAPIRAGPLTPVIMGLLRKDPTARLGAERVRVMLERVARRSKAIAPTEMPATAPVQLSPENNPGRIRRQADRISPMGSRAESGARRFDSEPDHRRAALTPPGTPGQPTPQRLRRRPARSRRRRAARDTPRLIVATATIIAVLAVVGAAVALAPWKSEQRRAAAGRHQLSRPFRSHPPTPRATISPLSRSSPGGAARGSRASPGPSTSPPSSPSTVAGVGGLPAGWTVYRDGSVGWRIAYPQAWSIIPRSDHTVDFRDPATGAYMRVAWTDHPGPDPEARWQEYSRSFAADHEAYHQIRIDSTTFHGMEASNWEFTFAEGGAELHANDLGFVTGEYGFALFFQTPADEWKSFQDERTVLEGSFRGPP
jgi:serine/threonine protein kinase